MRLLSQKTVTRYHVTYREDGILNVNVSTDKWDPADYKLLYAAIGEMANYKKVPLFLTFNDLVFPGSEEIKYFAKDEEAARNFKAIAIVTNSLSIKILTNFLIESYKPACPTKLFEKDTDAILWLRNFL